METFNNLKLVVGFALINPHLLRVEFITPKGLNVHLNFKSSITVANCVKFDNSCVDCLKLISHKYFHIYMDI